MFASQRTTSRFYEARMRAVCCALRASMRVAPRDPRGVRIDIARRRHISSSRMAMRYHKRNERERLFIEIT